MRKMNNDIKQMLLTLAALLIVLITSCDSTTNETTTDKVRVRLSGKVISSTSATRLGDEEFDKDDKVGVFITIGDERLSGERYEDNIMMTYEDGAFSSNEILFYPDNTSTCNFIGYYPYSESGIQDMSSIMNISVANDQSNITDFQHSDFMTARASSKATTEKVTLPFDHKFCKINIAFSVENDEDAEDIINNGDISFAYMKTSATYNLDDDKIVSLGEKTDRLEPYGSFTYNKQKKTVTGKKAMVIPQDLDGCKIVLSINGKEYFSSFPNNFTISAGKNCTVTVKYTAEVGFDGLSATITPWIDDDTEYNTELEKSEPLTLFDLSKLDFNTSSVYYLYDKSEVKIGEICREYLYQEGVIDDVAIVYYYNSNPTKGTVLQLSSSKESVCGGHVYWNSDNTLSYIAGTSAPVTDILYINSKGKVSTPTDYHGTESDGTLKAFCLVDTRDAETQTYPVQKIARQYWMREQLRAKTYNDGNAIIDNTTDLTVATEGYYVNGSEVYYNKAAVLTMKLAPEGWTIPSTSDFKKLQTYVGNNTSKLKAGEWTAYDGVSAATNITGFGAYAIGAFSSSNSADDSCSYTNANKYIMLWSLDDTYTTTADMGICIHYQYNETKQMKQNKSICAFSVRCLMK